MPTPMMKRSSVVFGAFATALVAACSSATKTESPATGTPDPKGTTEAAVRCTPDETAKVDADRCTTDTNDKSKPPCNAWVKVEIPGTLCSDGSQFKFFVNYSNTSNNLLVSFEPGGACWDYDSCSGNGGIRGAANPHGIPDDHMAQYQFLNLHRRTNDNPIADYNMVFVSYCTGDIHVGNTVATYTETAPAPGPTTDHTPPPGKGAGAADAQSITVHHAGHANTLAVIDWLKKTFKTVPKMLVTGCSAGGAGAILNYPFLRKGLDENVQCSYLLDDSGPIFHGDGPSKQLDAKIRSAWNVDPIMDQMADELGVKADDLKNDVGLVNQALSHKYPKDRLSLVLYRMDLNYSLYSYQRFFPGSSEQQIHDLWWQDIQELKKTYDGEKNLAYYIPFFRNDNCSHCVSIPPIGNAPLEPTDLSKALTQPWAGSEIKMDMIDLKQFTVDLLDDTKPLKSYLEDVLPAEKFTSAESMQCLRGG
jgi:hypothetical protein